MNNREWMRRAALTAGVVSSAALGQINVYQSSFESDDGGWVGTVDWDRGIPASTPDPASCEGVTYSGPPGAFDGQFVWATGPSTCYSNCGCEMTLSRTIDLTTAINPTLRYHWWKDLNGNFDYTSVHVVPTGTPPDLTNAGGCPTTTTTALFEQCDSAISAAWVEEIVDLASFEGQVVDVYFSLRSSAVVNHPGWYIDNVRVTSDLTPTPGDLQVAIADAPDPVGNVGDPITYTVSVLNADPNPINNVVVTTNLDAATNYVSSTVGSAAGGVHTATFASLPGLSTTSFDVVVNTTALGFVTVTSAVTGDATDPDTSNNTASATTEVNLLTDLSVAIVDTPDPIHTFGGQITYTVTVVNNGPLDANNVVLTVNLPPESSFMLANAGVHDGSPLGGTLTANFPIIFSGFSQIVSIRVISGANGAYVAVAAADGDEGDPASGNDSDTTETTVDVSADLAVALTDMVDPVVMVGSANTYTVTVTNNGPTAATGVNWNVNLPFEMTFASSSAGTHDGSAQGGGVSGTIPALAVGANAVITVDVTANALVDAAFTSASAFPTDPADPDSSDNSPEITTRVIADTSGFATVIFSDIAFPGLPTTAAPNIADRSIETIDRPFASPDGGKWAISLNLDGTTTTDDVIVVWDGVQLVTPVQEGATVMPDDFDLVGVIDQDLSLNDAGVVAFATSTDGPDGSDEAAATADLAGNATVVAREGDPVLSTPFSYGTTIDSVQIDNAGNVYFTADTTDDTALDEYIVRTADGFTGTVLFQEGITIPANQDGGFTLAWDNFDLNDFDVTGDGLHTLLQGDTEDITDFDQILAYDNSIVVQEGVIVNPIFFSPTDLGSPVTAPFLASNGDWYALGDNDDGEEWIIRNGQLLARDFDEVYPGAGLFWDDFISVVGDGNGNYVINGSSDDPETTQDGVLVLNGERIVARENDPVDVDGDGTFDDNTRISTFGADDAIITADGKLIVQVGTRGIAGELLVSFDLGLGGSTCACETDGNADQVNVFDLLAYLDLWFVNAPGADIDGAAGVDVFDLLFFLDCWFPASAGTPC